MRINFDFQDLEAFLAVKDAASFHRAGARLGMSQSSVTRRVRRLEAALGAPLFERTTRSVRPTLAGKRLQLRAEAMLQDARETARAMRDDAATETRRRARTVTLATIPTVVRTLVAPALAAVRAADPSLRARVLDLAANEVAEAVAQGEAELGICSIPMLEPATDFAPLFDEPMVLAAPPEHPLAARPGATWADLEGEALILPARGTGNRLLIDEALARTLGAPTWSVEVGRSATALDMVAAGVGLAPLPATALRGVGGRRVARLALRAPTVRRPIGLLTRAGHTPTAAASALAAALRAQAAAGLAAPGGADAAGGDA